MRIFISNLLGLCTGRSTPRAGDKKYSKRLINRNFLLLSNFLASLVKQWLSLCNILIPQANRFAL